MASEQLKVRLDFLRIEKMASDYYKLEQINYVSKKQAIINLIKPYGE